MNRPIEVVFEERDEVIDIVFAQAAPVKVCFTANQTIDVEFPDDE